MRVAILASGRSYHATRWANGLASRGINVGFFTIHPVVRPLDTTVDVESLGTGAKQNYILRSKRAKYALNSWSPDLVHSHYATGYGLLGKLSGTRPRIVSLYGADVYDFPKKSILHKALLRYILSGTELTLSTSETMAREFAKTYPDLEIPVVTPFGVDLNIFKPSKPKVISGKTTYSIGVVKKLEQKYGIDVLINSFSILARMHANYKWKLNIVGEGSQLECLKQLSYELGIQNNVKFYGAIKNTMVPEFIIDQDVFVVPSREESESFGVAAVEAQACGLPVIASNVGGLPEVVRDNITGIIVPKEDKLALAKAIAKICLNENIRTAFSVAARERAVRYYDWEKSLDQMIHIYRNVIEKYQK